MDVLVFEYCLLYRIIQLCFKYFYSQIFSRWWAEVSRRSARVDSSREKYTHCQLWRCGEIQSEAVNHHLRRILQVNSICESQWSYGHCNALEIEILWKTAWSSFVTGNGFFVMQ